MVNVSCHCSRVLQGAEELLYNDDHTNVSWTLLKEERRYKSRDIPVQRCQLLSK